MQVVKLDKAYKDDLVKIFRLVFEDNFDNEYFQFFINHDKTWEYIYGIFEDGKLVSTYISFDVEVKIRGKVIKGHYLDGLATLPPYRNRGFMREFFRGDVEKCLAEKIPIILLDPFKHSYYRKFGFEIVMDNFKLKADWDLLSKNLQPTDYSIKMDYLKDNLELQKDYFKLRKWFWDNSHYNEMKMPESYEEGKFHCPDNIIAIAYSSDNDPRGYLLYEEKNRTLEIKVFRMIDLEGFYALKKHILSYTDQVNYLNLNRIPPDFPLSLILDTYWRAGKYAELQNHPSRMMRVLNPQILLKELMATPPTKSLSLYITDELLPELAGRYLISTDRQVLRDDSINEDLVISNTDLAPLLTGRKSAIQLYMEGKLIYPEQKQVIISQKQVPPIIEELEKMFPRLVTFNAEEW